MSVAQGGPGFPILSKAVFRYPITNDISIGEIADEDLPPLLKSVFEQVKLLQYSLTVVCWDWKWLTPLPPHLLPFPPHFHPNYHAQRITMSKPNSCVLPSRSNKPILMMNFMPYLKMMWLKISSWKLATTSCVLTSPWMIRDGLCQLWLSTIAYLRLRPIC